MPTGSDYIRDERRRLANLIATTALWTERRYLDGSADGNAAARSDERTNLVESDYRLPLDAEMDGDVHRRFEVRYGGSRRAGGRGGVYTNAVQDIEAEFAITVAYVYGGGDSINGSWAQIEEIAAQDIEAVRQKLEHPANYAAGTATGITAGATGEVDWIDTRMEPRVDQGRLYARLRVVSRLRVVVEAA